MKWAQVERPMACYSQDALVSDFLENSRFGACELAKGGRCRGGLRLLSPPPSLKGDSCASLSSSTRSTLELSEWEKSLRFWLPSKGHEHDRPRL